MALDKRIHLYAVDTRAFYTDEEMELDRQISELRHEQKRLRENPETMDAARSMTPQIGAKKDALREALSRFDGVRIFREEFLKPAYVISMFDSFLTRTLEIAADTLTTDLIIVKTCYFKILEDLVHDGFTLRGVRYVFYTASAGQIRTKRSVFIREDRLSAFARTLMCGLTADSINRMGGVNTGKYLAYLALGNSATDPWDDFDIDHCIVVDDFETDVPGEVDYIDSADYSITRKTMSVPVTHTDGCGMILPSVSRNNFMLRLPWVKGLLSPFPFDKFIREADRRDKTVNHGLIRDIYGKEHDVLAEGIQIILTRSQFKMHRYYRDWEEYKECFRRYGCKAGVCNAEPDVFGKARLGYQMLQTLPYLSDEEITSLCRRTSDELLAISHDREAMLRVFGAVPSNQHKTAFQESLALYPELLQDPYCRKTLRSVRAKMEREAVAGRLRTGGVYTFILPDLYAFCQRLFLGEAEPSGLLRDGEVYCRLFPGGTELDCLRSPHLYREHAVRVNTAGADAEAKRWFVTNGLYTSSHDLISKILQFDCDGDKALVAADPTLVTAAKRNMEGVVPLYYEMLKAEPCQITPDAIYTSMTWAYSSCNIGKISNEISRIWNSDKGPDEDLIKLLCLDNNMTIDAAKTLYKPPRPDFVAGRLKPYAGEKVPRFFVEAKGLAPSQVAPLTGSTVNRIRGLLPRVRFQFDARRLGKFDWRMLTSGRRIPNNEVTWKIVETFEARSARTRFQVDEETEETNRHYLCMRLREELLSVYSDIDLVVDVLVRYLFWTVKTVRKTVFWECFGEDVLRNLRRNVDKDTSLCSVCGARFYRSCNRQTMCKPCAEARRRQLEAARQRRNREKNTQVENSCFPY